MSTVAGTDPAARSPATRQSTLPFLEWMAVPAVFVVAAKSRSVPTAVSGWTPKSSISNGVIRETGAMATVTPVASAVPGVAVLRIARELPRWQWTWLFHFIPRVIRDEIYDLVARNRYRWFGRRDTCILPNSDRSW